MRAIELSFQAFGPYYQRQNIDFTKLGDESIFLITGPTGSGKTTIFDAICYALYGRASGSDREQDTLRSHFAEPGFLTEVTFVFELKNRRFKVNRTPKQERHRKRGEGLTDIPARATLSILNHSNQWELLSSRISEVNHQIQELLRFDYEQFSKMVLIPQGEFRKLITENSREREKILQKLFQTYFYDEISEKFKERANELKEKSNQYLQEIRMQFIRLEDVNNFYLNEDIDENEKIDNLALLITSLKKELLTTKEKAAYYRKKINKQRKKLEEEREIANLFNEFSELEKEQELLKKDEALYIAKKRQLQQASEANSINPYYKALKERKKEYNERKKDLERLDEQRAQTELEYTKIFKEYKFLESEAEKREKLRREIERKEEEKALYEEYNLKLKARDKLYTDLLKYQEQLEIQKSKLELKEEELVSIYNDLEKESELIKLKYKKEKDIDEYKKTKELIKELNKQNIQLIHLRDSYKVSHKELIRSTKQLENLEQELQKYNHEKTLHYASEIRAELQQGDICPVCGSTNHEYSEIGDDSDSFSDELIKKTEEQIVNIRELNKEQQTKFVEIKTQGKSLSDNVKELTMQICERLNIVELNECLEEQVEEEIRVLEKELHNLDEQLNKLTSQKDMYQQNKKELETLKQTFEQMREQVLEQKNKCTEIDAIIKQMQSRLSIKEFVPQDFNNQLILLKEDYERQLKQWNKIEANYQNIREERNKIETKIITTSEYVSDINERYKNDKNQFQEILEKSLFSDIKALEEALLLVAEVDSIQKYIDSYTNTVNRITHRFNELQEKLADSKRPNLEETEKLLESIELKLDEIQQIALTLESKKTISESVQSKVIELKRLKTEVEQEYYIIGDLAETTEGNNAYRLSFERFVLATFLDEILLLANIRLAQMTDQRFELSRSEEVARHGAQSGLDLEVIDYYTGINRSVRTLSGGEGFKAALSLALGLADVVQEHTGGVQMDTMFIDEGFGTLDEISLQQAIECLKDLQDSNRLLGIISHVPQLKQEIHAKLEITPSSKGSSLDFVFSGE